MTRQEGIILCNSHEVLLDLLCGNRLRQKSNSKEDVHGHSQDTLIGEHSLSKVQEHFSTAQKESRLATPIRS